MAYSLRLPDALDAAARAKADDLGISLNALLCVALDAYLCGPTALPTPQPGATLAGEQIPSKTKFGELEPAPEPEPELPPKLSRAEKKRLHDQRNRMFRGG